MISRGTGTRPSQRPVKRGRTPSPGPSSTRLIYLPDWHRYKLRVPMPPQRCRDVLVPAHNSWNETSWYWHLSWKNADVTICVTLTFQAALTESHSRVRVMPTRQSHSTPSIVFTFSSFSYLLFCVVFTRSLRMKPCSASSLWRRYESVSVTKGRKVKVSVFI